MMEGDDKDKMHEVQRECAWRAYETREIFMTKPSKGWTFKKGSVKLEVDDHSQTTAPKHNSKSIDNNQSTFTDIALKP